VNCPNRKEGESESCGKCESCVQFMEGRAMHIVEIDAASNTGVDHVREHIIDAARVAPGGDKTKVFIIDEVHMLSTSAFNALLKTLEEPPPNVLFILATTELHKIPATILSRCQRFDFHRIGSDEIVTRLSSIAKKEGFEVEEDVLRSIAVLSEGCLRDAESLLEQVLALGETNITAKEASLVLPRTDSKLVVDLIRSLANNQTKDALSFLGTFVDQGGSVKHLTDELIAYVRSVLFVSLGDVPSPRFGKEEGENLQELAGVMGAQRASQLLDVLIDIRSRRAPEAFPQLPLEVAFVEFCINGQSGEVVKAVKVDETDDREPPTPPVQSPPASHIEEIPKPAPQAPPQPPQVAPITEVETSGEEESAAISSTINFTLEEIQEKWGMCREAAGKLSIAIPLVLQRSRPSAVEKGVVFVSFEQAFHFETISARKNIDMLEKAIETVMQCAVKVEPILEVPKDEKVLEDLVGAFGGSIIE